MPVCLHCWTRPRIARLAVVTIVLASMLPVRPAGAYTLRAPQVAFNGAVLQGAITALGSGINVYTDQINAQVVTAKGLFCSGSGEFAVWLQRTSGVEIGLYDARQGTPSAGDALFTPAAGPGWVAYVHFGTDSSMSVTVFNDQYALVSTTNYPAVDPGQLGLYVSGPLGTWYSQDDRNGGSPQVLEYAGDASNIGNEFLCVEPRRYDPASPGGFAGVIALMGPNGECPPLDAHTSTWGSLKSRYR